MIKSQIFLPAYIMNASSPCAIIQYQFRASEEHVSRMMRVPRGFRPEKVPAGWQIVQHTHNWYYGLRVLEE